MASKPKTDKNYVRQCEAWIAEHRTRFSIMRWAANNSLWEADQLRRIASLNREQAELVRRNAERFLRKYNKYRTSHGLKPIRFLNDHD